MIARGVNDFIVKLCSRMPGRFVHVPPWELPVILWKIVLLLGTCEIYEGAM